MRGIVQREKIDTSATPPCGALRALLNRPNTRGEHPVRNVQSVEQSNCIVNSRIRNLYLTGESLPRVGNAGCVCFTLKFDHPVN